MNFRPFCKVSLAACVIMFPIGYISMKTKQTQVWSWGFGRNGQLGLGTQCNMSRPHMIKSINFKDIDAKSSLSAGITEDGRLYTWGKNRNGVLGHHPPNMNVLIPRQVQIDEKVTQVSCGYQHLCVLTQKGNIYVWGITQKSSKFRKIGTSQTNRQSMMVKPYKVEISNVQQISSAGDYITFVKQSGQVYVMGSSIVKGINGAQGVRPTDIVQLDLCDIKKVKSGNNFSMALNKTGNIYVWGKNTFGQLGIGSLKNVSQPQLLQQLVKQKIIDINCGDNYSGAITQKGEVFTWGFGNEGQLGHGDKSDQFLPRRVTNLPKEKIKSISCGGGHTGLLTQTGKLYMMGRGRQGQLGRESNDQGSSGYHLQLKPVQQLPIQQKITKVVCGANHTLVLMEELN